MYPFLVIIPVLYFIMFYFWHIFEQAESKFKCFIFLFYVYKRYIHIKTDDTQIFFDTVENIHLNANQLDKSSKFYNEFWAKNTL